MAEQCKKAGSSKLSEHSDIAELIELMSKGTKLSEAKWQNEMRKPREAWWGESYKRVKVSKVSERCSRVKQSKVGGPSDIAWQRVS